jgi:excisionase family DNA binding protein
MSQSVSAQYLSEKEAAAALSVSLSTVRRWRRNGSGPEYFKLGGVLRYAKSSLEDFIKQHTKTAV